MSKVLVACSAIALSVLTSSCSMFSGDKTNTGERLQSISEQAEQENKKPIKVKESQKKRPKVKNKEDKTSLKSEEFTASGEEEVIETVKSPTPVKKVAGLIPSTNPQSRLAVISSGNNNPFALIPVQPVIKITPEEPSARQNSNPSKINKPVNKPVVKSSNKNNTSLPNKISLPQREIIAEQVEITGAVEIGGRVQLIVKAPDEPSSRYVQEGQVVSNGRVLVKYIDFNNGLNPTIVLKDLLAGVEITKKVGQKPSTSSEDKSRQRIVSLLPNS